MSCRRNANLHGSGGLGQNAHHHEFGGTKNKGAGSQSQNASFHSLSSMNVKRVGVRDCLRACVLRVFDFSGGCVLHMLFCTADALGNKKGGTEVPP